MTLTLERSDRTNPRWNGAPPLQDFREIGVPSRQPIEYAPMFMHSEKMRTVWAIAQEVAGTTATVLLRGESGVGKDVVARAIHAVSSRSAGPFVKVNCAALPSDLLESELFGHEKGAFTGAHRRKPGQFEYANNGTIYLDEIAELPLPLQAKLLHVLQDFRFSRVGGHGLIEADARVIAATNRDLEEAMARGGFREDLYYRLNVVELRIPPLRERLEEIPALSAWLLARLNEQYQRAVKLSPETLALLQGYRWPGNVRELDNLLRRLVVLGKIDHLHAELRDRTQAGVTCRSAPPEGEADRHGPAGEMRSLGLKEIARRAARESERRALLEVLERVHWNRTEAATILKVSYKTILNKIAELDLSPSRSRRGAESLA
jgi:two-component system response regulator AtoC